MNTEVKTWASRDGRRTPIAEMADTHLVNTLRKIERDGEAELTAAYPDLKAELVKRPQKTQEWYAQRVKEGK